MKPSNLTPRQRQAVKALITSDDQRQAAEELGITFGTYRCLIDRARKQARVKTNEQLVCLYTIESIKDNISFEF